MCAVAEADSKDSSEELPATLVRGRDLHRLIPAKYSERGESTLTRIADDDAHLALIFDLDHATNDRLLAENDRDPGIGAAELVFGVPHYRIINAAFAHPHPLGSRFSSAERGAWYCAYQLRTAQAEIVFHRTVQLAEIGRFHDEAQYDDYLCDIDAVLHDLRLTGNAAPYLEPDSYVASQGVAQRLLARGALGLIYPSVRRARGTCVAAFRPALVSNVRKGSTLILRWQGATTPHIEILAS